MWGGGQESKAYGGISQEAPHFKFIIRPSQLQGIVGMTCLESTGFSAKRRSQLSQAKPL